MGDVYDTLPEIADWLKNALDTARRLADDYPLEVADLLGLTDALSQALRSIFPLLPVISGLAELLADALSDPIVLDLDGDGLELIPLAQSATLFDLDGDGAVERTGWVGPQDGLLVHDANGNGTVDGIGELFGSANVDGFDELETLDANSDGRIDANDPDFAQLRVWRDLNSDGQSTPDEMQTLTEAGIASLNLNYSQVDQELAGNIVARTATFVRTDGTSRSIGSVNFALEEIRPVLPTGADLGDLASLPNLSGQLGLADLKVAMFFDPTLKAMVEDLTYGNHGFDTFAEFCEGGFHAVLYRWAGIDTSLPLGPDDLPHHLQAMEAFMGRPFQELTERQLARLDDAWSSFVQQMGVQFLFQATELPAISPFYQMQGALAALDPDDPGFSDALGALLQDTIAASNAAGPAYGYVEQFAGLSINFATGELSGDFDAFVAEFIESQPSFGIFQSPNGGGPSGPSIEMGGGDDRHPWTAWYEDQGSLLFAIADAMGIGPDYVLTVTGWRWLAGGFSTHEGTSGNDILDFTLTYYQPGDDSFGTAPPPPPVATRDQLLFGYEGNDELRGNDGVDRLVGGPGDDLLHGGSDSDMYVYALGDGLDRIIDTSGADDTIYFSSELDSANLQVTRPAGTNDLLLNFGNPAQGIILTNQWSSSASAVEHVHFVGEPMFGVGDLTSLYLASLATVGADTITGSWASERLIGLDGDDVLSGVAGDDSLDGGMGNDNLNGGDGNDLLTGGAGNDLLYGVGGSDILNGGLGNDRLEGWWGADTYLYGLGDGDDTIFDQKQYDSQALDVLQFAAGIAPSDVQFSRGPTINDVRVTFTGQAGSIVITNQWWVDSGIELIRFADGTEWTQADFASRYLAAQTTAGNDTIWGTGLADVAQGGDGNDIILGFDGNDTLTGGLGTDRLEGGDGADTYIYNLGEGTDTIFDQKEYDSVTDTLLLGAGIAAGDIVFSRGSTINDMRISFAGQSGSILVTNQWWTDSGIESVNFADGTVWDQSEMAIRYLAAQTTAGNDIIWGTGFGDSAVGGAGNDTIVTVDGNDTLNGGLGTDRLEGGDGVDTYIYNAGDGSDTIFDQKESDSVVDTLALGVGIAAADVVFSRGVTVSDMRISFAGPGDSILVSNQWWADSGIEMVTFADGTSWNQADLAVRYVASQTTSGNDTIRATNYADTAFGGAGNDSIYGFDGDDTLLGGSGNDRLEGGEGADTYVYNLGDGDDVIWDYRGVRTNTLEFGPGITQADVVFSRPANDATDLLITFTNGPGSILIDHQTWSDAGIELFRFSDGSTLTEAQANSLIGVAGGGGGSMAMFAEIEQSYVAGGPTDLEYPEYGMALF